MGTGMGRVDYLVGGKTAPGFSRCRGGGLALALALLPSCFLRRAELPPAPAVPPDLTVSLSMGEERGARVEAYLLPVGGGWRLFARRARGDGWPPLFDATFAAPLPAEALARLARAVENSGFFAVTPVVESDLAAAPLVLRIRQRNRVHQVLARGRALPGLERALAAIDAELPVALAPVPVWLETPRFAAGQRPGLAPDLERAITFHREWLEAWPERSSLHLDLFALYREAGRVAEAEAELAVLATDRDLGGLVPALRQMLGAR
jgi:hypothetical protein